MANSEDVEVLPAPVLAEPALDKIRVEQRAFRRLFGELLRKYPEQYVAIHDGEVVEVGDDKFRVADRAYARFGYIPILVVKVTEEEPVVRIATPRFIQSTQIS